MTSTSDGGGRLAPNGPMINGGLSLERLFEVAHATGDLVLTCRNLKSFPKHRCKYDLKDTVSVDLSRNKLTELPPECTDYFSLERLVLYHNSIRCIPDSVVYLQSLQFLDLSRNQISYLPTSICELPLQSLVVNNNKLVSLPEEIGKMATLMKLDASCNEITHLPVQIGDLNSLKVLNLRRNHLQEIPIEISYLQLTNLDLSGNRIVSLPVELRFMTSITILNLGENPLTCPPANLVARGRIHVFKYLEIQAIKEDRKRGVLTEGEYRRSYRKTTAQLNDFRFANGFGADARRKRHTADSGYGSEQPLDRRWSQEFNPEVEGNAEDARRIIMRAANCQRSPRQNNNNNLPAASMEAVIRGRMSLNNNNPNTPLTSTGSTTSSNGSSSGYSSISGPGQNEAVASAAASNKTTDYACPPPTVPVPSVSSSSESSSGTCRIIPIIKEKQPQNGLKDEVDSVHDYEKEERRRAAQRVLGKQASSGSNSGSFSKLHPKSQLPSPSASYQLMQKNKPNSSMLPTPNPISPKSANSGNHIQLPNNSINHRQLRQRQESLEAHHGQQNGYQQPRLTASALARMQQLQGSEIQPQNQPPATRSLYDVKAMQKEAVLSYVKLKQQPSRSSRGSQPELSNVKNGLNGTRASSTTSIPQPSPNSSGLIKPLGKLKIENSASISASKRHVVEKSATADAHINQLRMEIESRLRINLPEDISGALADGVILCHVANHVRPRAVPSIHVPSPSVPKLNIAKCRRNVENFLLACRKIGVREDLICSPSDILEPRKQGSVRVAISVSELLRFHALRNS